jgi:beta-lactamase superfamily II metal-dependent hydrolase
LGALRSAKKKIDLVYISHIDQDHIGGILKMLDDEVLWRVHDLQKGNGNKHHKAPTVARPPVIGQIWHNAFHEQLTKNAGAIEEALAASAPLLSGAEIAALRRAGLAQADLVSSVREAIQVSRRVGPKQLKIPLNTPSSGKLMMVRPGQASIHVGGMTATILGPTPKHLDRLRKEWNAWLKKSQDTLKSIRAKARQEERDLGSSELDRVLVTLAIHAEAFGNPEAVTPPNLASLTLLVEEGPRKILLTGDARGDQIVDGLQAVGRLGSLPFVVDVLKVPHHGSENNVDQDFCDKVVAQHYVFCGNGQHENPDLRVVELMARRRLAVPGSSAFKFWFNSSSDVSDKPEAAQHMAEVEKLVAALIKSSHGRMTAHFLRKGGSINVL